jgi:hypothetical protein
MGSSCSTPKQEDRSDREMWLLWEEPNCLLVLCGRCELCCRCEKGKFKDDYPPFLAARGIDEQAFKADVAAVTEHVREVTGVLHYMKDLRVALLIVVAIAAVAGSLTAKLKGSTGVEFALFAAALFYYMPVACLYYSRLKRAVTDEIVRLGPKYDKVGVTMSYEEVSHSSGEGSSTDFYLLFKVVQPDDAEAPPAEVVVAGEAPPAEEPPAEVVVAGEYVAP